MPSAQVEWTSDDMHMQVDACTSEARAATEVPVLVYKLQTFAKNSIWLEVQRTMDELLEIYIYKYICEYLWVSVYHFSLSKLIKEPIFQLKELSSWLRMMTTNWELLSTALAEVRIFV